MAAHIIIEEIDNSDEEIFKNTDQMKMSSSTKVPSVVNAFTEDQRIHNLHTAMSNLTTELPPVISLNVGGYNYMTRLSTLCKFEDSMLAAMFSGRHKLDKDPAGSYFVDSNGKYFGHILEFLRHDTLPPMDVALHVYKEASYYNISPMLEKLQTVPEVAKMIVKDTHRSQFPDYKQVKHDIIKSAIENAAVSKVGEVLIFAFKKEFKPKAPYFNPEHNCIAEAAHVAIGPWDTAPDEEMLIKSLEQDFVEEGFHIKTHDQKKRCKYYNGQNCQKSVYKITFLFQ